MAAESADVPTIMSPHDQCPQPSGGLSVHCFLVMAADQVEWKVPRGTGSLFLNWDVEELASQITRMDAELFLACEEEEFVDRAWARGGQEQASNVWAFVNQFNIISRWFTHMVLCQEELDTRVRALEQSIAIAKV